MIKSFFEKFISIILFLVRVFQFFLFLYKYFVDRPAVAHKISCLLVLNGLYWTQFYIIIQIIKRPSDFSNPTRPSVSTLNNEKG